MAWQELQPLKSLKVSHLNRGSDNEFNDLLFNVVEIDNSYDLNVFKENEIDFEHVFKKLRLGRFNLREKDYRFRVRKIRGRRAGTYYYDMRTIVVHPKYMDSFIHELGHLLDYSIGEGYEHRYVIDGKEHVKHRTHLLSKSGAFKPLWEGYVTRFKENNGKSTHGGLYGVKYYTNHKEVFARLFELYIGERFGDLTLNETKAWHGAGVRKAYYPLHDTEYMAQVYTYFDGLFGVEDTAVL